MGQGRFCTSTCLCARTPPPGDVSVCPRTSEKANWWATQTVNLHKGNYKQVVALDGRARRLS